jgi:hypothetical protein
MGVGNPSYFITTKNKKNMKNAIIVPFDLNTARMIKNGEIEGSVLIGNIEIEFVYESKNCSGPYNLLFVKKDESGISAIYADTEGRTFFNNDLELEVEAGAYFKKGDILISTLGNPFIYNGIINREGDMGCIYGISAYGEITSEEVLIWTSVRSEDKSKYVRLATEEEKKSFAERIANTENLKKAGIIKQYLSEYEYLLTKEKKCDFKPFDQVLVRASNLGNWNLHLFARVREEEYKYECLGGLRYKECIPYQGNEHLYNEETSQFESPEQAQEYLEYVQSML